MARTCSKANSYLLTDYNDYDWLDVKMVDALDTPFKDGQFDFVIASNMIHHVPFPPKFFAEVHRILKPGGKLLVQDVNCLAADAGDAAHDADRGLFLRCRCLRRQRAGQRSRSICGRATTWCRTCSSTIPQAFHARMPGFRIREQGFSETLTYLASGGVTAKTFFIPLPRPVLSFLRVIDDILCTIAPQTFALQRRAVLEKIA